MTDDPFAFGCGLGFILGMCSGLTIWLGIGLVERTTADNVLG